LDETEFEDFVLYKKLASQTDSTISQVFPHAEMAPQTILDSFIKAAEFLFFRFLRFLLKYSLNFS
jgi:hypothetical protein